MSYKKNPTYIVLFHIVSYKQYIMPSYSLTKYFWENGYAVAKVFKAILIMLIYGWYGNQGARKTRDSSQYLKYSWSI